MIEMYDVVVAVRELSEKVKKDDTGVVLFIYHDNPTGYEVEFVNNKGETLEVLTVFSGDIRTKEKIDNSR